MIEFLSKNVINGSTYIHTLQGIFIKFTGDYKMISYQKHLHSGKLKNWPLCTFCEQNMEIYRNLFTNCPYVKDIWLKMAVYMDKYVKDPTNSSLDTVFCNYFIYWLLLHFKYLICLFTKCFIC